MEICLVVGWPCAAFSDEFHFWEIGATILVSAIVTFFTIRWSVRTARDATIATLNANEDAERRRSDAADAERRRGDRVSLGNELIAASIEKRRADAKSARLRAPDSVTWEVTRARFSASEERTATDMFEWADLKLRKASDLADESVDGNQEVVARLLQGIDAPSAISTKIGAWMRDPEAAHLLIEKELATLRAWRTERNRVRVQRLLESITSMKVPRP